MYFAKNHLYFVIFCTIFKKHYKLVIWPFIIATVIECYSMNNITTILITIVIKVKPLRTNNNTFFQSIHYISFNVGILNVRKRNLKDPVIIVYSSRFENFTGINVFIIL